jgi:hypothetical protein
VRGSPIRTPSDQRSVGSSPRLIAASHVLHRLLMPRHPPCALTHLNTQQHPPDTTAGQAPTYLELFKQSQKMLASTVQFSTTHPRTTPPTPPAHPHPRTLEHQQRYEIQAAPDEGTGPHPRTPPVIGASTRAGKSAPSGPNSVPTTTTETTDPAPHATEATPYERPAPAGGRTSQRSTHEHHPDNPRTHRNWRTRHVLAWLCTDQEHSRPVSCSLERR